MEYGVWIGLKWPSRDGYFRRRKLTFSFNKSQIIALPTEQLLYSAEYERVLVTCLETKTAEIDIYSK
jgi:hypothetical protein